MDLYTKSMKNSFDTVENYFKRIDLTDLHHKCKADAIKEVQNLRIRVSMCPFSIILFI